MQNIYESAWSPKEYLAQFYATTGVAEDEKGIFQFVLKFLQERKQKFSSMLEVGCGPTIHHILLFLRFVGQVYMADYLEENLEEIRKWAEQEPDAHDWTQYFTGVLALEGQTSESAAQERMQDLRAKIAGLLPCDVLNANPLGEPRSFPLVTSFYCLECLGRSKEQWKQAMKNVSSLVAPGGWFIMSSLHRADRYVVNGTEFPTTNVDVIDLWKAMVASGYIPETIIIEVCPCEEWAEEGFSSILVARAQRGAQK